MLDRTRKLWEMQDRHADGEGIRELLVNPSHGDAAMASIDPRYRLAGIVNSSGGEYSVTHQDLDSYLVPKREVEVAKQALHESGRGIAYTRWPFAYLFERTD